MRFFEGHRRELTKGSFIRGTKTSLASTEGTLSLRGVAGLGIDSLTIKGDTEQPLHSVIDVTGETPYLGISDVYADYRNGTEQFSECWFSSITYMPEGFYRNGWEFNSAVFLELPRAWREGDVTLTIKRKGEGELASIEDVYLVKGEIYSPVSTVTELTPLLLDGEASEQRLNNTEYTHIMIADRDDNEDRSVTLAHSLNVFVQDYKIEAIALVSEPTISIPVPIKSTGDGGLSVELKGKNLIGKVQIKRTQEWVDIEGFSIENTNAYYTDLLTGFDVTPGTTYTITFDYEFKSLEGPKNPYWLVGLGKGGFKEMLDNKLNNNRPTGRFPNYTKGSTAFVFTTPDELVYDELCLRIPSADAHISCKMYISKFMLTKGEDTSSSYEAYVEPTQIEIPSQVNGIDLLLGGIGEYRDELIISKNPPLVLYNQRVNRYKFTGDEELIPEADGNELSYKYTNESWDIKDSYLLCTHFKTCGSLEMDNYSVSQRGNAIIFKTDGKESLEEFKELLRDMAQRGKPVTVYTVRNEPIEYDFSDTEWGKALPLVNAPYGTDCTLDIISALPPSYLLGEYYSVDSQALNSLIVSYKNEDGEEIAEKRSLILRKGSRYKLITPQIEGYEPVDKEITGVLLKDGEITIIYRRK